MDKLETPIVFKQGEEFSRFFEAERAPPGRGRPESREDRDEVTRMIKFNPPWRS